MDSNQSEKSGKKDIHENQDCCEAMKVDGGPFLFCSFLFLSNDVNNSK